MSVRPYVCLFRSKIKIFYHIPEICEHLVYKYIFRMSVGQTTKGINIEI